MFRATPLLGLLLLFLAIPPTLQAPGKEVPSATTPKSIGTLETTPLSTPTPAVHVSHSPSEQEPAKPGSTPATEKAAKPVTKESGKSEEAEEIDSDYSFLLDKMPDLPDEEYLEIGEDATPLAYLKQSNTRRAAKFQPRQPNVIYITIPIYISALGGEPSGIAVGGQAVPLGGGASGHHAREIPSKDPSPTSQFNRLLHYVDPPRRWTNRHRSNSRSRRYARKRKYAPRVFYV